MRRRTASKIRCYRATKQIVCMAPTPSTRENAYQRVARPRHRSFWGAMARTVLRIAICLEHVGAKRVTTLKGWAQQ
jgi:hypothetical protein